MNAARSSINEVELHAYLDGEVAPDRIETLERFFREHPQDLARFRDYHEQDDLIRKVYGPLLNRPLPAGFALPAPFEAASDTRPRPRPRRWLAAAAAVLLLLVGAGAGWLAQSHLEFGRDPELVSAAGLAHRVYVVERRHPVEVPGSEEAHLVEWLSNRLGVALATPDLTEFGYQLVGGRLLPATAGPAAQLMYEDAAGHRLTIYARPSDETPTGFRFEQEGELSAFYWRDPGASFAILAELSREELLPLARFIYTVWNA